MRCCHQEKGHFIYETFHTNLVVTTKHKSRTETCNTKKKLRKTLSKTIKPKWQTETHRKRSNGNREQSENKDKM